MTDSGRERLLYLAGSFFLILFCMTPIVYMSVTAASTRVDFLKSPGRLDLTLDHFANILTTHSLHFPSYLFNSVVVSGLSALFCVLLAAPAAYAMTRISLPGKMTLLFLVLAVSMFPQLSLLSYLFKFMSTLGWINTYQALILPYTAWILPLSLWILTSYFAQIPRDLDRAALHRWLHPAPSPAKDHSSCGRTGPFFHRPAGLYFCLQRAHVRPHADYRFPGQNQSPWASPCSRGSTAKYPGATLWPRPLSPPSRWSF